MNDKPIVRVRDVMKTDFDLIDGKLKGIRGVPLENRRKMETVFGQIFDD